MTPYGYFKRTVQNMASPSRGSHASSSRFLNPGKPMKTCNGCKKELPESSFSRRKSRGPKALASHCRSCRVLKVREYARNHRVTYREAIKRVWERSAAAIRAAKDKPCTDCGMKYPSYVMDFDHRNPDDKKFNLAGAKKRTSLKKIMKEIAKCDVVCSNCHRIRTHRHRE